MSVAIPSVLEEVKFGSNVAGTVAVPWLNAMPEMTLAVKFNSTSVAADHSWIQYASSGFVGWQLRNKSSDRVSFFLFDGSLQRQVTTTGSYTVDEWTHVVVRWRPVGSPHEMDIFQDSLSPVSVSEDNTNSLSATPTPPNRRWLQIGGDLLSGSLPGSAAELAVWNRFLPDSACAAMSIGKRTPAEFRDFGGVFYAPMLSKNSLMDLWHGTVLTSQDATVATDTHPPIVENIIPIRAFVAGVAPVGVNPAALLVGL